MINSYKPLKRTHNKYLLTLCVSFITGQFSTAENGITIPCLKTEGHLLVCGLQLRKLCCLFVGASLLRHASGLAQAGLEFTVLLPWSREGWNCRFCSTFDLSKRENLWLLVRKEKRKAEGHHYLQISKTLMTAWSSCTSVTNYVYNLLTN